MERLQLKAQIRKSVGKGTARKVRAKGLIPAIFYGAGLEPLPLSVDHHDFEKAISKTGSTNVLFDLEIEGNKAVAVMVRDYQADVLDRHLLHVDFQKIDLKKKVKVEVPIHLVGKAPGVKEGGILEHIRRHLEVICLPTAIPEAIDVDVSHLQIGNTIHVQDLELPKGVEMSPMTNVTVAAVAAPVAEKEEVPVEGEEVPTEPEVIGEKKEEAAEAGEPKEEKKK